MEDIIKWLQDLEKVILLSSNIILAVLALYNQVRAGKWKETAKFVMFKPDVGAFGKFRRIKSLDFVPKNIRKYYDKAQEELEKEEK